MLGKQSMFLAAVVFLRAGKAIRFTRHPTIGSRCNETNAETTDDDVEM